MITYEDIKVQIEVEDGQEVTAAFRKWVASEKSLATYNGVKKIASEKVLKSYRIQNNIKVVNAVKEKTETKTGN